MGRAIGQWNGLRERKGRDGDGTVLLTESAASAVAVAVAVTVADAVADSLTFFLSYLLAERRTHGNSCTITSTQQVLYGRSFIHSFTR